MSNDINRGEPPSQFFDDRKPRPIENTAPAGGKIDRSQYENSPPSKAEIKGDNHGGKR